MKRALMLVVAGAICMPLGCNGNADKEVAQSTSATTSNNANGKLVASNGNSAAIIPPNEIVAMFADSIRRGDRETVNKLITEASRLEIQKQGIDLDPPGSPDASYKIGEFRFSDEEKDSGFVESLWIEPAQDGAPPQSTEVVWGVRLENGGWRICGLAIDMGKDQPAALVNFEDLEGAISDTTESTDKVAAQAGSPATGSPVTGSPTSGSPITGNATTGNSMAGNSAFTPPAAGNAIPGNQFNGNAQSFAAPPAQIAAPPATDFRR